MRWGAVWAAAMFVAVALFGIAPADAAICPSASTHGQATVANEPAGTCDNTLSTPTDNVSLFVQIFSDGSYQGSCVGTNPTPNTPCARVVGSTSIAGGAGSSFVPQSVVVPASATCTPQLQTNAPGAGLGSVGVTIADGDVCTLSAGATANGITVSIRGTLTRSGSSLTFSAGLSTSGQFHDNAARAFLARRLDQLAAGGPDSTDLINRLEGTDGNGTGDAISFAFAPDLNSGELSTSLNRIRAAFGSRDDGAAPTTDVWLQGHITRYADNVATGDRNGTFGMVHAGIDHRLGAGALVGAMVSIDAARETSASLTSDISGLGWMAGPYFVARLAPNLHIDGRAAWGQSKNDITVAGDPGTFTTTRWLARLNATGSLDAGPWRLSPQAGVIYVEEAQAAYTTTGGTSVAAQRLSLGRAHFGPTLGYRVVAGDVTLEPQIGVTGLWDFASVGALTLDGVTAASSTLRARITTAVNVANARGASLRLEGSYDGLGAATFSAWALSGRASIPLH